MKILRDYQIPDMWTSSVEDFRARISASRENARVLTEDGPDCGARCLGLYGRLDPSTSSLRTLQLSLFPDSSGSYATFPKSGMTRNGNVYRTSPLDTHIKGKGFTLLPTPHEVGLQGDIQERGKFKSIFRKWASDPGIGYTCAQRILEIPTCDIVRNDDGFPDWSHRVGSIGNAVNPTVARYLFECIKIHENEKS